MNLKIAILASGQGSNAHRLMKKAQELGARVKIEAVISDHETAPVLDKAKAMGISAYAVSKKGLTRAEHEEKILTILRDLEVQWVLLAGYMRILTKHFLQEFKDLSGVHRVINIHPSLLPLYPGVDAYEQAYQGSEKQSGISLHFVDEFMDHGPLIAQQSFPKIPGESLADFKSRGLAIEHELYPRVLELMAQGARPEDLLMAKSKGKS